MATMDQHQQQQTGWVGWLAFAGVMMSMLAVFHVIDGLVALFKDDYFVVSNNGLVLEANYTAWGWAHIGIGVLLALAAASLFSGRMFGRVVGVIVAALSAVMNIAFLAAFPVWSVVMIAVDVIVIYAIVVHGREEAY